MKLIKESVGIVSSYKIDARVRYILDKMAAQTVKGIVTPIINAAVLEFAESKGVPFLEEEYEQWLKEYEGGNKGKLKDSRKASITSRLHAQGSVTASGE